MTEEQIKAFGKGTGDWEKLYDFMDENNFSCADFLACICANLTENNLKLAWQIFTTVIMVAGVKFKITIEPELFENKGENSKMKYIANLSNKDKIELSENDFKNAKEVLIIGLGKFNNSNESHKLIAIGEDDIEFFILYPTKKFIKRED